jgi:hypothetical protein
MRSYYLNKHHFDYHPHAVALMYSGMGGTETGIGGKELCFGKFFDALDFLSKEIEFERYKFIQLSI